MLAPRHRLAIAAIAAALASAIFTAPASSAVSFKRLRGFNEPTTPARYDKVGVLKTGPRRAKNVLILVPGTSASSAYFEPLAKTIAARARGWQVWSVERRENLLEDHSVLNRAKRRQATGQQLFDYYLGYLTDQSITPHFQMIPDSRVGFARNWGMRVAVGDLRRVVGAARKLGGSVVLGGHSLGGSITTAYATWDFGGRPGAKGLSGLVYIDGGSRPTPISTSEAIDLRTELRNGTPWLAFGGIPAPFAGLFNAAGSTGAIIDPNSPSLGQTFPLLPSYLKPPIRVTNLAQYGYALDTETSPPSLFAFQAHAGHLAASGDPRGWDQAGEITPIRRYAKMFAGWGLRNLDGTAWYHPQRLTDDSGAVAAGNANPAQRVLHVAATHGDDLPRSLRIYAFGARGGARILNNARTLARQSGIPRRNLTLVNRRRTYAHNDPAGAFPKNAFLSRLVPFLQRIGKRRGHH